MSGGIAWSQAHLFSVHGVLTEFNVQHCDSSHWETRQEDRKCSHPQLWQVPTPKTSQGYMA